jgi:hypothetical protein
MELMISSGMLVRIVPLSAVIVDSVTSEDEWWWVLGFMVRDRYLYDRIMQTKTSLHYNPFTLVQ